MFYRKQYEQKAHGEIEYIFRTLLPENGLNVRKEQIRLSHEMLDGLLQGKITLCDAGVGIGKTYAYLTACIVFRKYAAAAGSSRHCGRRSVVVSTSSIALQRAIQKEYIPFLSRVLLAHGIIHAPLQAVVRKGKEHFVCDVRLEQRIQAVEHKKKNARQRAALLSLKHFYDMDEVSGLSGFDRRMVCVPKFCPRDCTGRGNCRYQQYLKQAKGEDVFLQICNHNYLLADATHRDLGYRPLLADYRALIVDEAHKLPEAARQMYGKELSDSDVQEICTMLEREEHQKEEARRLREIYHGLTEYMKEKMNCGDRQAKELQSECQKEDLSQKLRQNEKGTGRRDGGNATIRKDDLETEECREHYMAALRQVRHIQEKLKGDVSRWLSHRLEEAAMVLEWFESENPDYILYLQADHNGNPILCASSRKIPKLLDRTVWGQSVPAILTSGTLKAGKDFARTRQLTGLKERENVRECVALSPFAYERNCLLYLPENLGRTKKGSREEIEMVAEQIQSLVCSTFGHTLVLFTSYTMMGSVCQLLKDSIPFPMLEVWRHSQEEIARFKTLKNAVLFAAGSCWEGVDFPGDMVSSLIIVRLPFAVPDKIREAEREQYDTLQDYIRKIIVPDMQQKLRQGFGRAIRTEQDTCVVSILDRRALPGGNYHEDVLCALPDCMITGSIGEVEQFIRKRKHTDYYME